MVSTTEMLRLITFAFHHLLRRHNCASAVCRIGRNRPVSNPDIDQRLHRLRIPICEKAVEFGDCAKVDEARIEVSPPLSIVLPAQVPERVDPMRVIEMSIDAENLTKACATIVEECLWKACALANPVATVRISADGHIYIHGCSRRLGREGFWIVDFASHPPLD